MQHAAVVFASFSEVAWSNSRLRDALANVSSFLSTADVKHRRATKN
jgi:hypothetical protein